MNPTAVHKSQSANLIEESAKDVIRDAARRFDSIAVACSFQKESSVIIDLVMEIASEEARLFTINPGNPFDETIAVQREIEDRYAIKIETFQAVEFAPISVRRSATPENVWAGDPSECCGKYKVAAFSDAIKGSDAWITGLRREQSASRANTEHLGWDEKNQLWKVCPLADWTEEDVWNYILEHDLPYNALHDQGYESIGCRTCTTPGTGREADGPEVARPNAGFTDRKN